MGSNWCEVHLTRPYDLFKFDGDAIGAMAGTCVTGDLPLLSIQGWDRALIRNFT